MRILAGFLGCVLLCGIALEGTVGEAPPRKKAHASTKAPKKKAQKRTPQSGTRMEIPSGEILIDTVGCRYVVECFGSVKGYFSILLEALNPEGCVTQIWRPGEPETTDMAVNVLLFDTQSGDPVTKEEQNRAEFFDRMAKMFMLGSGKSFERAEVMVRFKKCTRQETERSGRKIIVLRFEPEDIEAVRTTAKPIADPCKICSP